MFQGFLQNAIDFLWGISLNNERGWFMAHKQDFTDYVDVPMRELGKEVFPALAEEFQIPVVCSVDELLERNDIELVINLTPPKVHTEINRRILNAGKHVFFATADGIYAAPLDEIDSAQKLTSFTGFDEDEMVADMAFSMKDKTMYVLTNHISDVGGGALAFFSNEHNKL